MFSHATPIGGQGDDPIESGPQTRGRKKQYAKKVQEIEQQDISTDWLKLGPGGVLPSAKTIALKAQLLNWLVVCIGS